MHFRYRVRMHTDIQNIHRNMRTDVATWDKSVTLLYNLVLQQWSCGGERLLTNCPSEIDAKDRPLRPYLKTKVLHKWRNISCQEYTVVSILLALERTRDRYSCCLSLPSAAQWKASFSIACQIWSRLYWRWVVFKCVTANNCVFCGTASDAANRDPPVNRHSGSGTRTERSRIWNIPFVWIICSAWNWTLCACFKAWWKKSLAWPSVLMWENYRGPS